MQQIRELSDYIEEELEDAEKYIKNAIKYQYNDKALADMYSELSRQEVQHSMLQHEQGVRLIKEYASQGNKIPEGMQAIYDHLHEKHIEKAAHIKALQDQYKE